MVEYLRKKIADSAAARWTVLGLVSFTMLTGYVMTDAMAPLKTMLEQQLGWDSTDYGVFTSGYGWFNIFLLMLIFGGMILDKKGPRFTGVLSVGLMIAGSLLKYWAVSTDFGGAVTSLSIGSWQVFSLKSQVLYATLGFAIFGVGIEMVGITANKVVVKWFRGKALALALGLNVAAGRIGTAIAMFGSLPFARAMGSPSAPLLVCLIMFCIGLLSFLVFCVMDRRYDRETETERPLDNEKTDEEEFRFSDIFRIARIKAFWYITILCVLFYSAVFPFLKYATELMIQKFHVSPEFAGSIPALLPFGNVLLTPLFGSIYDRKGRGAAGDRACAFLDSDAYEQLDRRRADRPARRCVLAGSFGHVAFGAQDHPVPDAGYFVLDDLLDTELGPVVRSDADRLRARPLLRQRDDADRRDRVHELRLYAADDDLRGLRRAVDRVRAAAPPRGPHQGVRARAAQYRRAFRELIRNLLI